MPIQFSNPRIESSPSLGEGKITAAPRIYGGEIELAEGESRIKIRPFLVTLPSSLITEYKDSTSLSNPTLISSNKTIRVSIPTDKFPGKTSQFFVNQAKFDCIQNCELGCDSLSQTICDPYTDVGLVDYAQEECGMERWVTVVCTITDLNGFTIDLYYGDIANAGLAIPISRENFTLNQVIIGDIKINNYHLVLDKGMVDYSRREAESVDKVGELVSNTGNVVRDDVQNWISGTAMGKMYVPFGGYDGALGNPVVGTDYVRLGNQDCGPIAIHDLKTGNIIEFAVDPIWPVGFIFIVTGTIASDGPYTVKSNVGVNYVVEEAVTIETHPAAAFAYVVPRLQRGIVETLLIPPNTTGIAYGDYYDLLDPNNRQGGFAYVTHAQNRYVAFAGSLDAGCAHCDSDDWMVLQLDNRSSALCDIACQVGCMVACQTCQAAVCDCSFEYVGLDPHRFWSPDPTDPLRANTCVDCDVACDISCEAPDTRIGTYVYTECPNSQVCGDVTYAACNTSCESHPQCISSAQTVCSIGCQIVCDCALETSGGIIPCLSCDSGAEQPTCVAFNIPGTDCTTSCEHGETCPSGDFINCGCSCDSPCENFCMVTSQTGCGCQTSDNPPFPLCTPCDASNIAVCINIVDCPIFIIVDRRNLGESAIFSCAISPVDASIPIDYVWSVPSGNGVVVSGQQTTSATIRWTSYSANSEVWVTASNACNSFVGKYNFGEAGGCTPGHIIINPHDPIVCSDGSSTSYTYEELSVCVVGCVSSIEWRILSYNSGINQIGITPSPNGESCIVRWTSVPGLSELPTFRIEVRAMDCCGIWKDWGGWDFIAHLNNFTPYAVKDTPTSYSQCESYETIWNVHGYVWNNNSDNAFVYQFYDVEFNPLPIGKSQQVRVPCGTQSTHNIKLEVSSCGATKTAYLLLESMYRCPGCGNKDVEPW